MNKKQDGGPAFPLYIPTQQAGDNSEVIDGMTLRDAFAAKAMNGMLSANGDSDGHLEFEPPTVAKNAYRMADAMLAARSAA